MPEYIWYTSPDPKRRVPGAATYVHTHGRQGIFSDRAIMITQRQVGPAIDGILGQEISKIIRIYTDTHGFSAYGASLAWILGILMCPRLKNFNDRRLHIPTGDKIRVPENLKDVVVADISLKAIEKGWDGHLKVADAVMSGRISATKAIEMQGAARKRGRQLPRGPRAWGCCCEPTICCAHTRTPTIGAKNSGTSTTMSEPISCSDKSAARAPDPHVGSVKRSSAPSLTASRSARISSWPTILAICNAPSTFGSGNLGEKSTRNSCGTSRRWASSTSISMASSSSHSRTTGRNCSHPMVEIAAVAVPVAAFPLHHLDSRNEVRYYC